MNSLRFNHVFASLLIVAALLAFVIPTHISDRLRTNIQAIYWPIARPAHLLGARLNDRVSPAVRIDDGATAPTVVRNSDELLGENQMLRVEVANLAGRVAWLEARDKVDATLGDVRLMCDRFKVTGASADASPRDTLQLTASSMQGVREHMPVLYGDAGASSSVSGGGIAGWIDRVELGGATVALITDRSFGVKVGFSKFIQKAKGEVDYVPLATPPVLARGNGNGRLVISNLSWQQKTDVDLQVGDWVVLNDDDWPPALTRYRLGRIESIETAAKSAGYPIIKVVPPINLTNLKYVLVMSRH